MNGTSIKAHAAALYVALLNEGMLEEAASFIDWTLENLDLELDTDELEEIADA